MKVPVMKFFQPEETSPNNGGNGSATLRPNLPVCPAVTLFAVRKGNGPGQKPRQPYSQPSSFPPNA